LGGFPPTLLFALIIVRLIETFFILHNLLEDLHERACVHMCKRVLYMCMCLCVCVCVCKSGEKRAFRFANKARHAATCIQEH
jgi:hypothetical protein